MNKISKILTALFSLSLLLAGCQKEQKFKVEGVISDAEDMVLYLENIGISSVETLDSVKLNRTGKFHFSQLRPEYPDFYRLRLKNQLINLAVD